MRTIYLFDVDGTLTPPKAKAVKIFRSQFLQWIENKEVYLVSGGSFVRLSEQLGQDIMSKIEGVFACMGNVYYKRKKDEPCAWIHVYENKFRPNKTLLSDLTKEVEKSSYHTKTGLHYDNRIGMINFSIVGRNANPQQRKEYEEYDAKENERHQIVNRLREKHSSYDFVIGGAVSIDIFKKGQDKSQVIKHYFKDLPDDVIIHFVGDRIEYPGNDFAIAEAVEERKNGHSHSVSSWEDTSKLLNSI